MKRSSSNILIIFQIKGFACSKVSKDKNASNKYFPTLELLKKHKCLSSILVCFLPATAREGNLSVKKIITSLHLKAVHHHNRKLTAVKWLRLLFKWKYQFVLFFHKIYFWLRFFKFQRIIGINKSVFKICRSHLVDETIFSPIPVSIIFIWVKWFRRVRISFMINSENTRFHILSHLFILAEIFSGSSFDKWLNFFLHDHKKFRIRSLGHSISQIISFR